MGKVIMSGIVPLLKAPVTGILAQDIAVGSVVKLMEGGTAMEYLVVNQGIPSNSSLYDASCDGTWLLRKAIYGSRQWHTSDVNKYETSDIDTWLNGDFFNSLGSVERASVKQVKIPYRRGGGAGGTNLSGTNGLSCKVFLIGGYEVGWTVSDNSNLSIDGAKLDYFESGTGTTANVKRIGYLSGSAIIWLLRSPNVRNTSNVLSVYRDGTPNTGTATYSTGIRPAVVLPKTALFDETTLLLKGVA